MLLRKKPKPVYTEVREDQIELLTKENRPPAPQWVFSVSGTLRTVKRGDRVKIIGSARLTGRIVDRNERFFPDGIPRYRVRLQKKPKPVYAEVREDQLELIPKEKEISLPSS